MIDLAFTEAVGASDNTASVELEIRCVSLNIDGDWAGLEGLLKSLNTLDSNVGAVFNFVWVLNLAILAGLVNTLVWVFSFRADSLLKDVVERVLDPTATAAQVSIAGCAINELLLREAWDFTRLGSKTFEGSGCGESPAGTALCLVLDSADSSLCSPIKGLWNT